MEPANQNQPEGKIFFKKFLDKFRGLQEHEKTVLFLIMITGLCLFFFGSFIVRVNRESGLIVEAFATIVTVESVSSTLNAILLSKKKTQQILSEIDNRMTDLKHDLTERIKTELLESQQKLLTFVGQYIDDIKKFTALGMIDLWKGFDISFVIEEMRTFENGTLWLQRLYFSTNEFLKLEDNLIDLIVHKHHTVKILLLAPIEINTIKKRLRISSTDEDTIMTNSFLIMYLINSQLKTLYKIKSSLPFELREMLQIRFHANPIVAAITAYDEKIIHCPYLNHRSADDGIQIEVRGKKTALYKEWYSHFTNEWDNASTYKVINNQIVGISYPGQNAAIKSTKTLTECLMV